MRGWSLVALVVLGLSACGGAEIGEECPEDETGSEDPCVDGAICDTTADDRAECMKICDDDTDCPTDASCTGVSGSNVEVVTEMIDLISSQRAYEINQRVIQAADEMLRKVTER